MNHHRVFVANLIQVENGFKVIVNNENSSKVQKLASTVFERKNSYGKKSHHFNLVHLGKRQEEWVRLSRSTFKSHDLLKPDSERQALSINVTYDPLSGWLNIQTLL